MSEPVKTQPLVPEQRARVAASLESVLASPAFRNSKQCQRFLRYVVEHTLAGSEDHLKERSIGVELFGREPDYDTAADPVVRVRATEVRKRLSQYYGESSLHDELRFEMPQGSYRAELHWMPVAHPDAVEAARQPDGTRPSRWRPRTRWLWVGVAAAACLAVIALAVWTMSTPKTDALDAFWAPFLESPKPVLLYCGRPVVYFLSRDVHEKYRDAVPAEGQKGAYVLPVAPDDMIRGRDIIPVTDQFVGIGNAHTAAMLSGLFARRGKSVEIRYANDLSFSDLRSSPSVLIGAFSNLWTMEMTRQLRFVFEQEKGSRRIRDRVKNTTWQLNALEPDGKTNEDYAVVTRLSDSATGQLLVSAAGITQYGTRAAGEFLTDSRRMGEALAGAAAGWPNRNVQVLLHTDVYRGTPAPPKVIATYIW